MDLSGDDEIQIIEPGSAMMPKPSPRRQSSAEKRRATTIDTDDEVQIIEGPSTKKWRGIDREQVVFNPCGSLHSSMSTPFRADQGGSDQLTAALKKIEELENTANTLRNELRYSKMEADFLQFAPISSPEEENHTYDLGRADPARLIGDMGRDIPAEVVLKKEFEKSLDSLEEILSCEVCTEKMWYPYLLQKCGHTFCENCLSDWFKSNQPNFTCPLCRQTVTEKPVEVFFIKKMVDALSQAQVQVGSEPEQQPERSPTAKDEMERYFMPAVPPPIHGRPVVVHRIANHHTHHVVPHHQFIHMMGRHQHPPVPLRVQAPPQEPYPFQQYVQHHPAPAIPPPPLGGPRINQQQILAQQQAFQRRLLEQAAHVPPMNPHGQVHPMYNPPPVVQHAVHFHQPGIPPLPNAPPPRVDGEERLHNALSMVIQGREAQAQNDRPMLAARPDGADDRRLQFELGRAFAHLID